MATTLLIIGFILMLLGIAGSVLPVLPSLPISWLGLLMIYLTPGVPTDWGFLVFTFVVAIFLFVLDYFIPAIGTKGFGGSKAGAWGSIIGLIVGLVTPIPLGVLIGPFVGAFIAELLLTQATSGQALKAAFGSFVGFLASTFMKLVGTTVYLGLFVYKVYMFKEYYF